jgi:EAL domain-containing protein (putative c-di-GMP-specific phosphodiesterase class I)
MRPLTMSVLATALGDVARWRDAGLDLRVAVNIPPQMLLDGEFAVVVAQQLEARGLDGTSLRLEITEDSLMRDPMRSATVLEALSAARVTVSIDDFGTGYSSLALLQRLPVHEIKVDRSFVRELPRRPNDAAIVRSTINLGRTLGLEVVAEGVESDEALEQLAGYGCDTAQGYVISRPVPADELTDWLESRSCSWVADVGRPPEAPAPSSGPSRAARTRAGAG